MEMFWSSDAKRNKDGSRLTNLELQIGKRDYHEALEMVLSRQKSWESELRSGYSIFKPWQFRNDIFSAICDHREIEEEPEFIANKKIIDELLEAREKEKEEQRAEYQKVERQKEEALNDALDIAQKALPDGSRFTWADIDYQVICLSKKPYGEPVKKSTPDGTVEYQEVAVFMDCVYKKVDGSRAFEEFFGTELTTIVKQQQETE